MTVKRFNKLLIQYKYSRKAVKGLYDYYYPFIVKYINYQFHGRIDGRDIAQQFFLKLFSIEIRTVRKPVAWVCAVAKNIALEILRKDKARSAAEARASPSCTFEMTERASDILRNLSDDQKEVMYLRYWDRYKLKEIAELLGKKYEAVLYLHKTAKNKLRKEKQKELLKCKST